MKIKDVKNMSVQTFALLVLFLLSWIIFGFNTDNPDYMAYEMEYNNYYVNSGVEIGFQLIGLAFKHMGAPFIVFRAVISFVCLAVIIKCICDYTDSPLLAYVAYLLFPFFFDVIQIRMFITETIVLYAVRFLNEFNKRNVIKYVTLLLFATTFHITALLYSVLMVVYFESLTAVIAISVAASVFLMSIRFMPWGVIISAMQSLTLLGENFTTAGAYLTFVSNLNSLMLKYWLVGGAIIMLGTCGYLLKSKELRKNNWFLSLFTSLKPKKGDLLGGNLQIKLLWATMIFIPLFSFGSSFGRLYHRSLLLIYCIVIHGKAMNGNMLRWKTATVKALCVLIAVALFYTHILDGFPDTYHRVFRAILDNNALWD